MHVGLQNELLPGSAATPLFVLSNLLDLHILSGSVLSKGAGKDVSHMNLPAPPPNPQVLQAFLSHSLALALSC